MKDLEKLANVASAGYVPLRVLEIANFLSFAGFFSGPWGPSSVQGSVMAEAPAAFQGPQDSLACGLGQLYGCAPSELTTPWTFAWGHGTKGHGSAV